MPGMRPPHSPTGEPHYLQLSPAERILLAQDILDSVVADANPEPLTPDQLAEIDRRIKAVEAGTMRCHRWSDVRDEFLKSK